MAVAYRTASSAEIRAAVGTTVTQRTVTNRLLQGQLRARRPVACISLTRNHCRLRREWCQGRAHWRTEWRSVVFSDESRFCLCASDGRVLVRRRPGERLQPTCLWPRHTRPIPGVMDNSRPHIAVVTQHALQSVDMLPWPARSPDLSPIEHVWNIIGRQLQRHPLTVPVLTDQVQQAWNFIPQTDIWHL
ncbi:hypothetical protein AVEN_15019-1 [Araneus ventricosus]|uniref:Transposable element Tc1 transposase n=1 Tax=Araneus ventricosus TaxID=182803 RepID=A0A4Y2FXU5_ARAVE|nr:hypothetical protein AVEN_15019-1 [Araneus ventricosus]